MISPIHEKGHTIRSKHSDLRIYRDPFIYQTRVENMVVTNVGEKKVVLTELFENKRGVLYVHVLTMLEKKFL